MDTKKCAPNSSLNVVRSIRSAPLVITAIRGPLQQLVGGRPALMGLIDPRQHAMSSRV